MNDGKTQDAGVATDSAPADCSVLFGETGVDDWRMNEGVFPRPADARSVYVYIKNVGVQKQAWIWGRHEGKWTGGIASDDVIAWAYIPPNG